MTPPSSSLQYALPATPLGLQLRASGGVVYVYFGVWPLWLYVVGIVTNAIGGVIPAIASGFLLVKIWSISFSLLGRDVVRELAALTAFWMAVAVGTLICTGVRAYRLHYWGRLQRVLTATSSGVTLTYPWMGKPRHSFWSADQFTAIELRDVHSIVSSTRTITELRIRRRRKWPRTFRLSSADSQLPKHIATQLAATLGCPLTIR